jgi:hypothetical protein
MKVSPSPTLAPFQPVPINRTFTINLAPIRTKCNLQGKWQVFLPESAVFTLIAGAFPNQETQRQFHSFGKLTKKPRALA